MKRVLRIPIVLFFCIFLLVNCATSHQTKIENNLESVVMAENLDCCDDFKQQAIRLNPKKEVIILIHGCKASSGNFNTLKEVFEVRGQQAICFSYNYRDSIEECSGQLLSAINILGQFVNPPKIVLIGHSQGALVARRALITNRSDGLKIFDNSTEIQLVTISGPFNGIKASSHCGLTPLHIVSGGITVLICQAIAGSTWSEINPSSDFINNPGFLSERVVQHIKINTDEEGSCRSYDKNGNCSKSDFVFSLPEQYNDEIDRDSRVINVVLKAGHAQVVGTSANPPYELISVLEKYGVLEKQTHLTLAEERELFQSLY